MEDLAKLIFAKKGKRLEPAFEHGRILVQEYETRHLDKNEPSTKQLVKRGELYLLERPTDEEEQAVSMHLAGFDRSMLYAAFGDMFITRKGNEIRNAKFKIGVNENERSRGYGTVLMSAGARYGQDAGIQRLSGTLLVDNEEDYARRLKFYNELGMNACRGEENVTTKVNNPELCRIQFATNPLAEEIWNSLA